MTSGIACGRVCVTAATAESPKMAAIFQQNKLTENAALPELVRAEGAQAERHTLENLVTHKSKKN